MDTSGELGIKTAGQSKAGMPSALVALTVELSALVDRLEADWRESRTITRETAGELHDLRARAERMLGVTG